MRSDREERRTGNAQGLPCRYRVRALFNFAASEYEGHAGRPLFPNNPVTRIPQTKAWYRVERRLDNSCETSYPGTEWAFHPIGNRIEYNQVSMNASPDRHVDHVGKRNTAFGRWMPAILYAVNIGGALSTVVAVGATDLLYLAVFPLPAVILYLWRTAKEQP